MATLVGVSEERSALYFKYPSEPILAEVALTYVGCMSFQHWVEVIEDLNEVFTRSRATNGARGKFVGIYFVREKYLLVFQSPLLDHHLYCIFHFITFQDISC